MNIPRRRFLGLAGLAVASVAGLSACGSNTGRPETGTSPTSSGAKPQLTQWYHEYGEDGVEAAVKRYAAAYPDATVTVKWNPGDYNKLLAAALLTSNVPDVFETENGPSLDMIKAGQVADLTELIGDAKSQFSPNVLASMSWEDKIYAIPQTVDMQLLYYRKSVLEKAGVQPPTTLDALTAAAKKVATDDMGGFFAGNDGGIGVLSQMLIWASGQEMINTDKTGIGFDNDAGYAALAAFADLYNSSGMLKSASADWYDAAAFANGETAMQWGGLWSLPDIQKAWKDDFGVLPFPAIGSAGRQAVPFGAYGSTVATKGKDPEAAKAFVKWLWIDNDDDQVDFSNSYGTHIPAKPALVPKADKIATGAGAEAAKFVNELGHAPDKLWTAAITQAMTGAVSNVATKKANPKTQVAAVAAVAKKEIARVK